MQMYFLFGIQQYNNMIFLIPKFFSNSITFLEFLILLLHINQLKLLFTKTIICKKFWDYCSNIFLYKMGKILNESYHLELIEFY